MPDKPHGTLTNKQTGQTLTGLLLRQSATYFDFHIDGTSRYNALAKAEWTFEEDRPLARDVFDALPVGAVFDVVNPGHKTVRYVKTKADEVVCITNRMYRSGGVNDAWLRMPHLVVEPKLLPDD